MNQVILTAQTEPSSARPSMVSALMQRLYSLRTMLMLFRYKVPFEPIHAHNINLCTSNGSPNTGDGKPLSDDNYAARFTVVTNNARTPSFNRDGYRNPKPSLSMTALQSLVSKA